MLELLLWLQMLLQVLLQMLLLLSGHWRVYWCVHLCILRCRGNVRLRHLHSRRLNNRRTEQMQIQNIVAVNERFGHVRIQHERRVTATHIEYRWLCVHVASA